MLAEEISNDRPENISYRGKEMKTEEEQGRKQGESRSHVLQGTQSGLESLKAVGGGWLLPD